MIIYHKNSVQCTWLKSYLGFLNIGTLPFFQPYNFPCTASLLKINIQKDINLNSAVWS